MDATYRRYLTEIAEQLGPKEYQHLPRLLNDERGRLGMLAAYRVSSFEQLFQLLYSQSYITLEDISLLQWIMEELGKGDLLYPLYELVSRACAAKRRGDTSMAIVRTKKQRLQHYYSECMRPASASEFSLLLVHIGNRLTSSCVKTLCYLLQDLLTRYKAASLHDGVEVLDIVKQRNFINANRPDFLLTLLKDIEREDLCFVVEQYKMSFGENQAIEEEEKSWHFWKTKSCDDHHHVWTRKEYRFRLAMKKVADQLCPQDLENMKLLCQGALPASELEKVENILDLFWLLENNGKLSIDNLYFLEELLENKQHLLDNLYSQMSGWSSQPSSRENSLTRKIKHKIKPGTFSHDSSSNFKAFQKTLKCIGLGLAQKEVKNLKLLHPESIPACNEIKTGVQLMCFWQKHQLVTPVNFELLRKGLYAIGRQDLCKEIVSYHNDTITESASTELGFPQLVSNMTTSSEPVHCLQLIQSDGPLYSSLAPKHATQVQESGTNRENLEIKFKNEEIDQLRKEVSKLRARLHQVNQNYKMLEHQNHSLLLHIHQLTTENTALHRLIDTTTTAPTSNIFMNTPL